jgi:hypothetical protein
VSDSFIRRKTLEYAASYTQIAERLLRTGRITMVERIELAAAQAMVELAVGLREAPADSIPPDYLERVDAALARLDLNDSEPEINGATTWN